MPIDPFDFIQRQGAAATPAAALPGPGRGGAGRAQGFRAPGGGIRPLSGGAGGVIGAARDGGRVVGGGAAGRRVVSTGVRTHRAALGVGHLAGHLRGLHVGPGEDAGGRQGPPPPQPSALPQAPGRAAQVVGAARGACPAAPGDSKMAPPGEVLPRAGVRRRAPRRGCACVPVLLCPAEPLRSVAPAHLYLVLRRPGGLRQPGTAPTGRRKRNCSPAAALGSGGPLARAARPPGRCERMGAAFPAREALRGAGEPGEASLLEREGCGGEGCIASRLASAASICSFGVPALRQTPKSV